MKTTYFFYLTIWFMVVLCHDVTGQQQWPMASGCRERTSWASSENTLSPPFDHIVSFLPDYEFPFNSLSIYKNILCTGLDTQPNSFYGIDMTTKDTLWSFAVPGSAGSVSFTAAQNDSLVFVGGQQGAGLYCLDRQSGTVKWFREMSNLYTKNPILDEDRLYIICDSLYCLNIASGDTIWTYPVQAQATPTVDESKCYITAQMHTWAFDKINGNIVWKRYNAFNQHWTNIIDGPHLYNTSNDSIISRNKFNGTIEWVYKVTEGDLPWLGLNFVAVDDNVLAFSIWTNEDSHGEIYALNKANGQYKWHHTFTEEGAFSPTIANHVVYVVCWNEEKLYGFDENTGDILFEDNSYPYEPSQPVVYNHKLYAIASGSIIELGNTTPSAIEEPSAGKRQSGLTVFPNPSSGSLTIEYSVDDASLVTISVYNISGERTVVLAGQLAEPGNHRIGLETSHLPPGLYVCEARIARCNPPGIESVRRTTFVVPGF
jgi:outer membrane protein assembly factor BamB